MSQFSEKPLDDLLQRCAEEPIHVPGQVQPHGCLVVYNLQEDSCAAASENCQQHVSTPQHEILGRRLEWLLPGQAQQIREQVAAQEVGQSSAFLLAGNRNTPYNLIATKADEDQLLLEFEPAHSDIDQPIGQLGQRMKTVIQHFEQAKDTHDLYRACTAVVRQLTSYDRVMVYRFGQNWEGEVVAEDRRFELEPYLGLRYPASDIPQQARQLYTLNTLRQIPDVQASPVPILGLPSEDIDLTYGVLRGVSPVHLEYLSNMGVRATLTISILLDGELWGMIACHHYAPYFLSHNDRNTAELLGRLFSHYLKALHYREEELADESYKKVENSLLLNLYHSPNLSKALFEERVNLQNLQNATGWALVYNGNLYAKGQAPLRQDIRELVRWLAEEGHAEVFATSNLAGHNPDFARFSDKASGVLALCLSSLYREYLLFFRAERALEVRWGGNPYKRVSEGEDQRLHPRQSFSAWKESIRYHSEPWSGQDWAFARNLREHILNAILNQPGNRPTAAGSRLWESNREVEGDPQQNRLHERNMELSRRVRELEMELAEKRRVETDLKIAVDMAEEMDRVRTTFLNNLSHDIRNPINAIMGVSDVLKSETEEPEVQHLAASIHGQAEKLLGTLQSLIDYAQLEARSVQFQIQQIPLLQTLEMEIQLQREKAQGKGLVFEVAPTEQDLPTMADPEKTQQVFRNVLDNAVKFTHKGGIYISFYRELLQGRQFVVVEVRDTGIGIASNSLEEVFQPFSQQSTGYKRRYEGSGLGLTIAKKLLEQQGGKIALEALENQGTQVKIYLPEAEEAADDSA